MRPNVRRAVTLVVLAVVLAVTCTFLGRWQWHRHVARDAQIAIIEGNYDAAPVPLTSLLGSPTTPLPGGVVWRQATVTGRYDAAATVLLRNRPIGGEPGYHVLVPLVVASGGQPGAVLVVDRGWVPTADNAQDAATVPSPPAGLVTVTVHLRQDEPPKAGEAPAGQVQRITIDHVLAVGGASDLAPPDAVYDAYGSLAHEVPAPAGGGLGAIPEPDTDPGSHLSYAFQWWTFALGSLVGFSAMARREIVDPDEDLREPRAPRRRRGPTAEDEEDAILDADEGRAAAPLAGPAPAGPARPPTQASETRSR